MAKDDDRGNDDSDVAGDDGLDDLPLGLRPKYLRPIPDDAPGTREEAEARRYRLRRNEPLVAVHLAVPLVLVEIRPEFLVAEGVVPLDVRAFRATSLRHPTSCEHLRLASLQIGDTENVFDEPRPLWMVRELDGLRFHRRFEGGEEVRHASFPAVKGGAPLRARFVLPTPYPGRVELFKGVELVAIAGHATRALDDVMVDDPVPPPRSA